MKTFTSKRTVLALSFALPAAVMTAAIALCGITPFGTGTLGVMDMAHQYLSFLASLRDILAGRASMLYLPSMCLGGNMLGLAAYYLTSPLNLVTCLFSRETLYDAVSLLYILRVGLCGLTMAIYAGRRHGYGLWCLLPATAYALMAYMTAYSFNYLWQDCVILLPLVALGIAQITRGGRPWIYIIALGGALWMNFYIGYILCLFSVLFFLFELFSLPRQERERPWHVVGIFALSSLAAGALSAVVLLPTVFSLSGGKAEFSLSELTLAVQFDPVSFFTKLYPGAFVYEQIMPDGLPQIFCGTATVALAALYFANGSIPRRRRILTGLLLAVISLSFWVTALDLIWHGFNRPNWYNHRYSFVFSFLLAAAAGRELTAWRGSRRWHPALVLGLLAAVSCLVFVGRSYDFVTWRSAVAAAVIAAVICTALFLALREGTGRRLLCALGVLVLLLHVGEMAANAKITLSALSGTAPRSDSYAAYVSAKEKALALADTGDTFQRVESTDAFSMNRCEPMLFGYDGVSHYASTISQDSLNFLDRLGFDRCEDIFSVYGEGITAGADSLLGIRYVIGDAAHKGYTAVGSTEAYTVWENMNALPIAWTADGRLAETLSGESCYDYLNALYAASAPEVGETVYFPAAVESAETENFTQRGADYIRIEESPATVTYTLTALADGALYGELGIPEQFGVMVFVNDAFCAMTATAQINGSLYLGDFAAGDTVTVRLQASSDITINYAAFVTEDTEALGKYADALKTGGCDLTKLSPSHYKGAFTTGAGDAYLLFTLPYDSGWHILLDGEKAAAEKVQECLMAISVTEGEHTVELRYIPRGLIPGACISLAALGACVGAGVVLKKREKK